MSDERLVGNITLSMSDEQADYLTYMLCSRLRDVDDRLREPLDKEELEFLKHEREILVKCWDNEYYKNQDVVFSFERDNDNYFALVWGDPSTMQIRNTEQMMRFFEDLKEDIGEYVEFRGCNQSFKSSSPSELVEFLVEDFDSSIISEGGLIIRCLASAF